jgi:hypothetical protein
MRKIFIFLLVSSFIKCYSQASIDSVVFIENEALSYNIYIPINNGEEMKTLFFFDPSASGFYPVNKYKALADKYSFILIGSNDSRNGPIEESFRIMDLVVTHSTKNFKVDERKIYFSGFSGGARTSVLYASIRGNSIGVIGCGSGFQPMFNPLDINFSYVGIVGNRDMNYLEMILNEEKLNPLKIDNFLIEFDGTHRWPDIKSFEAGISWLLKNEYNEPYYKEFILTKIDSLREIGALTSLGRHERRAIVNGVDLSNPIEQSSKEYLKHVKNVSKIYENEEKLKDEILVSFDAIKYSKAYASTDLKEFSWWQGHNGRLSSQAKKSDEKAYSAMRLLNFFGANSYERGYFTLVSGDTELAKKYFEIFDLFANNWVGSLWLARVSAMAGDWDECAKQLKIASKKGLQNIERFKNDSYFKNENASKIIDELVQSN